MSDYDIDSLMIALGGHRSVLEHGCHIQVAESEQECRDALEALLNEMREAHG